MDFNDIQKVWDENSQTTLFTINEKTMERLTNTKSRKADRWADRTEKKLIILNTIGPLFLMIFSFYKQKYVLSVFLLIAYMLASALYIYIKRKQRIKSNINWETDVLGILNRGINNAKYLANLTKSMRYWYLSGIAVILMCRTFEKSSGFYNGIIILFFALFFYASKWEQKLLYDKQYKELIDMRKKLLE